MKKTISLIVILCLYLIPISALAKVSIVEPVPDLMNDAEGFIVLCAPADFQERLVKSEYYPGFLSSQINRIKEAFRGTDIGELFAKTTSSETDYAGKATFDNVSRFAIKKGYQNLPQCSFVNGQYVSGGLKIELVGHKTTASTSDSSYIFLEKNHQALYQKIPLHESPFIKTTTVSIVDEFNLSLRHVNGDDPITYNNYRYKNFYDIYGLEHARIFDRELFSFTLDLPVNNKYNQNNFLQFKITDGRTKRTAIKLNYNTVSIPHGAIKLSRQTYCSDLLHLKGFCNREIASRDLLVKQISDPPPISFAERFAIEDYHLDSSSLSNYGTELQFNIARIEKTGNVASTGRVLVAGKLDDHTDTLVFGEFNFSKGTDLPDIDSPIFDKEGLESSLSFSEISQSEIDDVLLNIYLVNPEITNSAELAYGVAPKLSWEAAPNQAYYRGSDAGGYRVYRNNVLIAELPQSVTSYEDDDLYQDSELLAGYYRYSVVAVNSKGEYYYPVTEVYYSASGSYGSANSLAFCNQHPFQSVLVRKYDLDEGAI